MNRKTNALLAALIAGTLASVSAASFAQTTSDAPTSADQKAAKEQTKADKKAAVAQAKAEVRRDWLVSSVPGVDYAANQFLLGLRVQR